MNPHDARLLPAAGAAWLAAAAMWLGWGWWPLGGAAVALAIGWSRRSARPAIALAVCAGVAGGLAGCAASNAAQPVIDSLGRRVSLEAHAASDAAPGVAGPTEGLWRVELDVDAIDGTATRARVIVWGDDDWKGVVRGEALTVGARLVDAQGGAVAMAWRPDISARDGAHGLSATVAGLRAGLRDATEGLPERLRPLTRGMVIGDDSGMSSEQRGQMSVSGLTHLTAVSGSHFAIVLVAVTAGLRTVVRSRRAVAVATGVAMALLVCLVFPEPSVVRAATMAAVIGAALWWGRPAHALPALCSGVIAVSFADPRLVCEAGFAMSAAAVAAIALWAPALAHRLERKVPPIVAHPLAVCLAAQGAVLPLLALIDGTVGPWAVVANLAVGWCAAPVTLIGLSAVVVAPLSPSLAHILATASGWCAWPVDAAARVASSLPGADASVPPGAVGAVASAVVLAVAVALTFANRVRLGIPVLAGMCVLAVVASGLVPRLLMADVPGDWLVVACDVGQGDAMLLRTGTHSAVAIDVGPEDGAGPACLERYGVRRIDLLIITHPHADHEGALPQVVRSIPIAEAWLAPAEPSDTRRTLEAAGIPVTVVSAGTSFASGDTTVAVLAPQGSAALDLGDATGINDASIVTLSSVGGVTVLGLGDLEHEGQRALARGLGDVIVDVVKVPHHGSDRQEAVLADLVTARVAVVSVGAHNTYGHPAPDAIEMWSARVGSLLRTDLCGDIVITEGPALAAMCPPGMEN